MKLLSEEKAQGAMETLGLVAIAIVIVVIVGFYLKTLVTEDIQGEFQDQLN